MWTGLVQPVHRILTLPTGSVQEAARYKTFTGGYDGVQSKCWKVSGVKKRILGLSADFQEHPVDNAFLLLLGV